MTFTFTGITNKNFYQPLWSAEPKSGMHPISPFRPSSELWATPQLQVRTKLVLFVFARKHWCV